MSNNNPYPIQKKVYAYILKKIQGRWHLLVFEHMDFPKAGIQVPGGTVEEGESVAEAAVREVKEETGLQKVELLKELGVSYHDMRYHGLPAVHERHYFHFRALESPNAYWIGYEADPSDGSPGPIALKFYWVDLDAVPLLAGETDEMLPELIAGIK